MVKHYVLELYSGIGGMHWGLQRSGVEYEVLMAVDINTTANLIYHHNFPDTNLQSFGLEKLTLQKLESLGINTVLMSPPCQPFTRVGKKGDCEDVRTKSFLHILQLLKGMKIKPAYVLVENVQGFETSQTRSKLIECLEDFSYTYQEFLLTPLQFGIPNCRLRYYLIAKWKSSFSFTTKSEIMTNLPKFAASAQPKCDQCMHVTSQDSVTFHVCDQNIRESFTQTSVRINECEERTSFPSEYVCWDKAHLDVSSGNSAVKLPHISHTGQLSSTNNEQESSNRTVCELLRDAGRNMRYCEEADGFVNSSSLPLSNFMERGSFDDFKDYWLSDRELRLFVVLDIVFPALKKSMCFTKRYGHYVDGAGSVVQMSSEVEDVRAASEFKAHAVRLKNRSEWGEAEFEIIRKLKLRYFTPREVANLMCFPPEFDFPASVSRKQKYRVLGNSVNIFVVAQLIALMSLESGNDTNSSS